MRDGIYVDAESGTAQPLEQKKHVRRLAGKARLHALLHVSNHLVAFRLKNRSMLNALRLAHSLRLLVLQSVAVFPAVSR